MSVRQTDIAKAVGMDVSSVNKILNRRPGPVFREETIRRVFEVARQMGYNFDRMIKGNMESILREVFPANLTAAQLAILRGLPLKRVKEIQKTIYRSA